MAETTKLNDPIKSMLSGKTSHARQHDTGNAKATRAGLTRLEMHQSQISTMETIALETAARMAATAQLAHR